MMAWIGTTFLYPPSQTNYRPLLQNKTKRLCTKLEVTRDFKNQLTACVNVDQILGMRKIVGISEKLRFSIVHITVNY
jgi:hypothetical protein